jgi:hypothetical protein
MQIADASPEVLRESLRIAYQRSLFHTAKSLCGYKDIVPRTHLRIVNCLEATNKRKMVCVPRGTFKSSICSVAYPIWLLMNNPNLRILIDSELYTNCVSYLREIKLHLQSEFMIKLFGSPIGTIWNESEIVIRQRTKILKEPSIAVGGIGTTKVGQHYDYIIGDDYNSPANTATHEQRRKVIDHYQYNQSILDPDGTYAIIGTRYHEDDLIGWIIKNEFQLKNLDELKIKPKINGVIEV